MKPILLACLLVSLATTGYGQIKYNGITTISYQKAALNINGIWNSADHTGNALFDGAFDKYIFAHSGDTIVIKALEAVAARIKSDSGKFISADGKVNLSAINEVLTEKFSKTSGVTIPSYSIAVDSLGNQTGGLR